MKLDVQTVIEGSQREGIAWGITPDGQVVLVAVVGSRRVLLAMSLRDASETMIGAGFAIQSVRMAAAAEQGELPPQRAIVGADGVPLGGGK